MDNTTTKDTLIAPPAPVEADKATSESSKGGKKSKRFLPDHKKPDAALTFPEKVRTKEIERIIYHIYVYLTMHHAFQF